MPEKKCKLSDLIPDKTNANKHTEYGMHLLEKSVQEFGLARSIVIDQNNNIIGGNGIVETAGNLGMEDCIVVETRGEQLVVVKRLDVDINTKRGRELCLADNATSKANLSWDEDNLTALQNEFDIDLGGWGIGGFLGEPETGEGGSGEHGKLSDRFIIPPFSVLDTKQGIWQQRKNYWISLGIKSEIGRDAESYTMPKTFASGEVFANSNGTSIFDPVLCELAYMWFNVPNGNILDPFAGGSVRGIVAAKLGFNYVGNDLSGKQIEANRSNAIEVLGENEIYPTWTNGDSLNIDKLAKDYKADLVFSCPPYADLEVYSKDKEDLLNMEYDDFIKAYTEIIRKSCEMLKNDRFACFVVGDIRDKKGFYRNFVSDTINAFHLAGVMLYNEIILVNAVGTLAIRSGRQFAIGRKCGKQHQNVLVFYKGNPKNIKANYPELDLSYIDEIITEENENEIGTN